MARLCAFDTGGAVGLGVGLHVTKSKALGG